MSVISLQIDGKEVAAEEGTTILEAASAAGVTIPTLCHHQKLAPYGACRLCIVEVGDAEPMRLLVSCVAPVEQNLNVVTRSKKIDRYRKSLIELMMARAPHSSQLQEMGREYGAQPERFEKDPSFCIHCGLCVRYCAEVKGNNAVGFIDRGIRKEISFIPEIALDVCDDCKECFPLCPTSYLQAVYVLTRSLAGPSQD